MIVSSVYANFRYVLTIANHNIEKTGNTLPILYNASVTVNEISNLMFTICLLVNPDWRHAHAENWSMFRRNLADFCIRREYGFFARIVRTQFQSPTELPRPRLSIRANRSTASGLL